MKQHAAYTIYQILYTLRPTPYILHYIPHIIHHSPYTYLSGLELVDELLLGAPSRPVRVAHDLSKHDLQLVCVWVWDVILYKYV